MRRGNGEGSIFKLSGKRRKPWAVRVTVGWTLEGRQKFKYLGYFENKQLAKQALREYLVSPYDLTKNHLTLLDVYEQWEKATTTKPQTIKVYKSAFNQALSLHGLKMREIKIADIENAMGDMKASIQASFRNIMRQLYNHAIRYEIVEKDLSVLIKTKEVEHKQRKPFTLQQIEQIKAFNHKFNDITIILLYTGMRINELLEMKKEDVHITERYMIGGKKTKAGQNRVIPIHDDIFHLVLNRFENSSKFLIESNGKPIPYRSYMTLYWDRLREYLGTDQTPHCTRHTFISQADRNELKKTSLKKIVGHATGDVTDDRYTHKEIHELLTEINKLKY